MMETITDALNAMGKASSMEIAARLGMDRQEVINQLWELKEAEVVKQDGHSWELVTGNTSGHVENSETKPVSMKAEDLINIITEKGPMTAVEQSTASIPVAASLAESDGTETLTLPTIAHLRQRIKQQKAGARHDEQLLKHLIRVHRLLEVTNG